MAGLIGLSGLSATVVIPTLNRPGEVVRCIQSVLSGEMQPERIIVCDQSRSDATRRAVEGRFGGSGRVEYLHLDRPNASAARNAGLHAARTDLLAFIDDDCQADRRWLAALVEEYDSASKGEDVAAVTGRVLPIFTKGRKLASSARVSTVRRVYRARDGGMERGEWAPWDAGTGANIFAPRRILLSVGGFDAGLGPGSPSYAAEDIDLLYRLMRRGAVVYQPEAVVYHPAEEGGRGYLRRSYRYGLGMGYMLARHIRRGDRTARRVLVLYFRFRGAKLMSGQLGRLPPRIMVIAGALAGIGKSALAAAIDRGKERE